MYKHFIKINENNEIIDSFSDWQKDRFDGAEIFIEDSNKRHYQLNRYPDEETGIYPLKYIDWEII